MKGNNYYQDFESKLISLGIKLPEPPKPVGAYLPSVKAGELLFISGVVPTVNGRLPFKGKVGEELTVNQGYEAARIACLNMLSIVKKSLGTINKVRRVVKLTGYVASAKDFHDQPKVVNGASELLEKIFGDVGRHSRVAIGVYELPLDSPVELEAIIHTIP